MLQGGIYYLQIMDWYSSTFSLMVLSFTELMVIGWIYGQSPRPLALAYSPRLLARSPRPLAPAAPSSCASPPLAWPSRSPRT